MTRHLDPAAGAWNSARAGRNPAVALQNFLRDRRWDRSVTVRFERRSLRGYGEYPDAKAEPQTAALFVGLSEDGTVSADAWLERGGRSGRWLVTRVSSC